MLHDCQTQVRWLRAHAADFGLDPRRFAAWGISAGGHLAALLALTAGRPEFDGDGPHREQDCSVCAVVNWCGPTDLWRTATDPIPGEGMRELVEEVVGGPIRTRAEVARAASPVHQVHSGAPPHLHVHGRRDPVVPVWHAEALHERLLAAGAHSELYINEAADHALGLSGEDVSRTRTFLVRHLQVRESGR
jgi:acetyl esterase/lipase